MPVIERDHRKNRLPPNTRKCRRIPAIWFRMASTVAKEEGRTNRKNTGFIVVDAITAKAEKSMMKRK